jgi:CBS-domain-containing membrane protein
MTFLSRLTLWAIAGALVGLLAGLVLTGLDVAENPFWLVAAGIGAAAVLMPVTARRRDRQH